MNTCWHCNIEITKRYRINEHGDVFCKEECYERYYEDNDMKCTDNYHPYINDYETIRSIYIDWLDNWEEELITRGKNFQYSLDTVVDLIDKDIEPYWDYYVKQGDDGAFSREIYLYYQKLQDLQKIILSWRPEHDLYYYLSFQVDHPLLDKTYRSGEEFVTFLNHIQEFELRDFLADHVHPYDEMAFYFDTKEEVEKVKSELLKKFGDDIVDSIYMDTAYLCDGECYDIEVIDNVNRDNLDGWFFCVSCEDYYPGFFRKKDLLKEIQLFENHPIKNEFYIRKIKRSCRYYDVEFPDWIYLID